MKILARIAVGALLLQAVTLHGARAQSDFDALKNKATSTQYANISIENGRYFLKLLGITYLDANGNDPSDTFSLKQKDGLAIVRRLSVPVDVSVVVESGGGNFVQIGGWGDSDEKTGRISNIKDGRIADIFSAYKGVTWNIGLTFVGGGRSVLKSQLGAVISDSQFSLAFVGPAGTPIGINSGIVFENVEMKVSPVLATGILSYEIRDLKHNRTLRYDEQELPISDLEQLALTTKD